MTPYDAEVVRRRLQFMIRTVDLLEADAPGDLQELAAQPDGLAMAAAEHRLVVAAQAVADISAHIVVSEGFGAPDDYRSAVLALGAKGIIDAELAERLARAVGLRNVLVHLYVQVEPLRVVEAVEGADDFRRFARDIEGWMARDDG
jgi:uncharacterized protein YutE (UPF0331/DUF86 family)